MMKASCFNIFFRANGLLAVWNSRSGTMAVLSESDALALRENRIWDLGAHSRQFLLERGMLVEEPDELEKFLNFRHATRQLRAPHFRILTTTACNARCAYCYERNFPI